MARANVTYQSHLSPQLVHTPAPIPTTIADGTDTNSGPWLTERWTPPRRFEQYTVQKPVRPGIVGGLWLVEDDRDGAQALARFVPPSPGRQSQRALAEARTLARLSHPNLSRVRSVGIVGDALYVVYESADRACSSRVLAPDDLRQMTLGLARALAVVHRSGMLHRNIKPSNIVYAKDGAVQLTDFGLNRVTNPKTIPPGRPFSAHDRSVPVSSEPHPPDAASPLSPNFFGDLPGAPRFMAPEMWHGQSASPATDVFALGVTLYRLATGYDPHPGNTIHEIAQRICTRNVPLLLTTSPHLAADMAMIIDGCLRMEPKQRFASGEEVCRALEGQGRSVRGTPIDFPTPQTVPARRAVLPPLSAIMSIPAGTPVRPARVGTALEQLSIPDKSASGPPGRRWWQPKSRKRGTEKP